MQAKGLSLVLSSCLLLLTACGAGVAGPVKALGKVSIGYPVNAAEFTPVYIAEQQGFFRANGIDARLHRLRGSATETPALLSGSIQAAIAEANSVLTAIGKGAKVVFLASDLDVYGLQLWAKPSMGGVRGLVGKSLALANPGSLEDSAAHQLLAQFGIKASQVHLEYLGNDNESISALIAGKVDAAIVPPPEGLRAESRGFKAVYNLGHVPHVSDGLVMTRAFAQNHPKEVTAILKSYIEALQFTKNPANRKKVIKLMGQFVDISDSQMLNTAYQYFLPLWQSDPTISTADLAPSVQWVASHSHVQVSAAQALDLGPLKDLEKSHFIKK